MGRDLEVPKRLATSHERIEIIQITGVAQTDLKSLQAFGPIDAFFDISAAANSTHFKSCTVALRHPGRISLVGGLKGDLAILHSVVSHRGLQLKGKWMYSRQNVKVLIKMIEIGLLKLGGQKVDKFALEDGEKGFNAAREHSTTCGAVIIVLHQKLVMESGF